MNKPQATVVGAGLMSFMPGLTPAQRSSVKLAVLQAERETRFVHEQGQVQNWYSYYKNKLKFYGWDAVPHSEVHWPGNERSDIVDSALKAIPRRRQPVCKFDGVGHAGAQAGRQGLGTV